MSAWRGCGHEVRDVANKISVFCAVLENLGHNIEKAATGQKERIRDEEEIAYSWNHCRSPSCFFVASSVQLPNQPGCDEGV